MKKSILVLFSLLLSLSLVGCSGNIVRPSTLPLPDGILEYDTEEDNYNRLIVSQALGVPVSDKSINSILGILNTIGSGKLQNADYFTSGGVLEDFSFLYILSGDDTLYQIYLSPSDTIDSVLNVDTDEWVIEPIR